MKSKEPPVLVFERKKIILDELYANKSININQLAERFNLSKETIRRDIREFEKQGLLKKTHGGAIAAELPTDAASQAKTGAIIVEQPIKQRRASLSEEKNDICKVAAAFVQENDVMYIDNSSTTISLVNHIPKGMPATIITNSLMVILEAYKANNPNLTLFCLPGFFNTNNFSLYGTHTVRMEADFFPTKAFISCAGILPDGSLADSSLYETETKRAFIKKSKEVFLLADSSKFSRTGPYLLVDLDSIDCIITDKINPDFNWTLPRSKSVKVVASGKEQ